MRYFFLVAKAVKTSEIYFSGIQKWQKAPKAKPQTKRRYMWHVDEGLISLIYKPILKSRKKHERENDMNRKLKCKET